ncbi:hypothetical protein OAO87_03760, partial [bacterium]|nr:hypothetical protein [bacterium]
MAAFVGFCVQSNVRGARSHDAPTSHSRDRKDAPPRAGDHAVTSAHARVRRSASRGRSRRACRIRTSLLRARRPRRSVRLAAARASAARARERMHSPPRLLPVRPPPSALARGAVAVGCGADGGEAADPARDRGARVVYAAPAPPTQCTTHATHAVPSTRIPAVAGGEGSTTLASCGEKHYMKGGKPGFYPTFDLFRENVRPAQFHSKSRPRSVAARDGERCLRAALARLARGSSGRERAREHSSQLAAPRVAT